MKIINNSYGLIFNILLTALVLVLISACAPTPAPAPAPAPAPIKDSREVVDKDSREVVENWFEFAKNQEWNKMENIARKAWISDGIFCPWLCAKEIAWHYRSIKILSVKKIKPISDTGETLHSYQVIVKTPSGDETMQVKVYKELVSGQESTDGIWGVDPII